jgi:hypothetical protein
MTTTTTTWAKEKKQNKTKTKQSKGWSVPPRYGTLVCFEYGSQGIGCFGNWARMKGDNHSLTTWNVF